MCNKPQILTCMNGDRGWLTKALSIAQIQSPGVDDGTTARILWKLAQVMDLGDVDDAKEAQNLRTRAAIARREISGRTINDVDEQNFGEIEESYNYMVPGSFR